MDAYPNISQCEKCLGMIAHGTDALRGGNFAMAEAAFRELQSRGTGIPRQMSLVAYDDVPWMSMVQPPITTVSQHTATMGEACADLLVAGLDGHEASEPITRSISPSLVVRGSVARFRPLVARDDR